jgi:tRNA (guanosine-2'-O-)-methyltransferase
MRRDHPDAFEVTGAPALPATAGEVIAALRPLLTDERLARIDAILAGRTRSVIPVLDGVDDPHNVAAILRSAEAFGTQEVHLVEGTERFMASQRVTQGTDRWLDLVRHTSPQACVDSLHARGYAVYVATMNGGLTPDDLARVPRVAIAFGNEHVGVSDALARAADGHYTIPMRGFAQSLNVSVATAITLYGATRPRAGDLEPADMEALRARFMMLSVPRADEVVAQQLERRP